MNSPLIIADQNMPLVETYFGHLGEVKLIAGRDIDRQAIKGAEILLVRSVTEVNSDLLQGSAVRFVGSATAGTDHIDLEYLEKIIFNLPMLPAVMPRQWCSTCSYLVA